MEDSTLTWVSRKRAYNCCLRALSDKYSIELDLYIVCSPARLANAGCVCYPTSDLSESSGEPSLFLINPAVLKLLKDIEKDPKVSHSP